VQSEVLRVELRSFGTGLQAVEEIQLRIACGSRLSPEDEAIRAQFEAEYGDGAVEDEKE
jgi:hypothetical protein